MHQNNNFKYFSQRHYSYEISLNISVKSIVNRSESSLTPAKGAPETRPLTQQGGSKPGKGARKSKQNESEFDAESRLIWNKLNLDVTTFKRGQWNAMDPIWRNPSTNGTIYVGNQTAAENLALLQSVGISYIVNCTTGDKRVPNFHEEKLRYLTFPVRI